MSRMNPRVPSEADIRSVVDLAVDTAHPLRIVMFGSAARGEAKPGSDVDLLIIVPDGTDELVAEQDLYRALQARRELLISVDFVVATASSFEASRNTPGLVYREAIRDGRDVYAA